MPMFGAKYMKIRKEKSYQILLIYVINITNNAKNWMFQWTIMSDTYQRIIIISTDIGFIIIFNQFVLKISTIRFPKQQ